MLTKTALQFRGSVCSIQVTEAAEDWEAKDCFNDWEHLGYDDMIQTGGRKPLDGNTTEFKVRV